MAKEGNCVRVYFGMVEGGKGKWLILVLIVIKFVTVMEILMIVF
jgi:hypothetical protein